MALFGLFVALLGQSPLEVYALIWRGGFASSFSWQNTLSRAAPLMLTALCVALPLAVAAGTARIRYGAARGSSRPD